MFTYSIATATSTGVLYPRSLNEELFIVSGYRGFSKDGDSLIIDTDGDPASIVADHGHVIKRKKAKQVEVDVRTRELIDEGFTFDSKVFSLSLAAQMNWNQRKHSTDSFNWPNVITTKEGRGYSLAEVDVVNFWTAHRDGIKSHYDSGRTIKIAIHNATTIPEIEEADDTR